MLTCKMKWRKFCRHFTANPLVQDLRLIQFDKRYLYRDRIAKGTVGLAFQALREAHGAKHFVYQRGRVA